MPKLVVYVDVPADSLVFLTRDGTTIVYAGTFLGRRYETQAICTDWTENKRFATKTISRRVYIENRYHARAGGDRYPGDELLPRRKPRPLGSQNRSWSD